MIPEAGETFRQFRVLSRAGEGGMGVVLQAHDTRLGRDVALKFLTRLGPVDAGAAERMQLEARSLAALQHANIVTIYDIGELDGAPFLVLEWVPGRTLAQAAADRPLAAAEFLRIAVPVAEALAAAHSRGIVHRDLKPGNVLLAEAGGVKLVDFGLAQFRDAQMRLTKSATVLGTASYMSPEQAEGGEVGPASDVFAFGAMAYELLTGRNPFGGASLPATLYAIVHEPHEPLAAARPGLPAALVEIVERCLRKAPADRYSGGSDLVQALHGAVRHLSAAETVATEAARRGPARRAGGPPQIRYCRTADGVSIAYSTHGSGPLIVRVLGWFTHLEMEWEWPALRLIWERLGETHTVVRYDGRGIGLSGPWTEPFSEETRQLDLAAVLKAVGAERVALYGISEGGFAAAEYALHHPEQVSHLILYGGYARGKKTRPGYDEEEVQAVLTLIRKGWGRDNPQYRQMFTTGYFGSNVDPGLAAHFNQLQRAAADGDTAARYQDSLNDRPDAREAFAKIRTPTLVVHCRDDQIVPFEEGQILATTIPDAELLALPTGTHYFPVEDEITHRISDAIDRFTLPG